MAQLEEHPHPMRGVPSLIPATSKDIVDVLKDRQLLTQRDLRCRPFFGDYTRYRDICYIK